MTSLSFAEVSIASRNAMLSAKVCKALRQMKKNADLDSTQKGILSRGANLLSDVVQGSLLIERRHLEEMSSRADLKAYSHAISALGILRQAATDKDVTAIFQLYRDELIKLSEGKAINSDQLDILASFFGLLSEFFSRDTQKAPSPMQSEPVLALVP